MDVIHGYSEYVDEFIIKSMKENIRKLEKIKDDLELSEILIAQFRELAREVEEVKNAD